MLHCPAQTHTVRSDKQHQQNRGAHNQPPHHALGNPKDASRYRVGWGIGVSFGTLPEIRSGQFEMPHLVTMPFSIMNFSEHT